MEVGWEVILYAGQKVKASLPMPDYTGQMEVAPIKILCEGVCSYNDRKAVNVAVNLLNHDNPDAVAIVGYSTSLARAALGWCRFNRRGALLMSESQEIDYKRNSLKEAGKKMLISLYDAALVGGVPHAVYLHKLGMPLECISLGYDVVDNAFWASKANAVRNAPQQWRRLYKLPENFFLCACRFISKKNIAGLIRAYSKYNANAGANPWHLVIVGTGPLLTQLRDSVYALGLEGHVSFPGYLDSEALAVYYGLASCFVLPSLHSEQWGLVVNEAMAAGLPVLVSRICGCASDIVKERVTGYTFDPHDENSLAGLMLQIHRDPIEAREIGRNAQTNIMSLGPAQFASGLLRSAEISIKRAGQRRFIKWPKPSWWV
jgi:glycosyltransferase involved in cell wall biosynthesis